MTERHNAFFTDMAEATRLTQAGRLGEATALIQRGLVAAGLSPEGPRPVDASAAAPRPLDGAPQLEGPAHRLDAEAEAARHTPDAALIPERLRENIDQMMQGLRSLAPSLQGLVGGGPHAPRPNGIGPEDVEAEDGQFVERSFSNAAGARDYKLFIPSPRSGRRPLLVMLHGCTQSPDDFAAGTRMNVLAEEEGIYVVYPRQSGRANAQRCWNWFEPGDQGREMGEAGIVAGLVRAVCTEHPIDRSRIYIAGLSAGGAAAANIARAYPDLFAGLGVHSGLAAGCARDLPSALSAMRVGAPGAAEPGGAAGFGAGSVTQSLRVPTIVFHGEGDGTVHPRNADAVLAQAGVAVLTPQRESGTGGGHSYTRTRYADETGRVQAEAWSVQGAGHAWSGGSPAGSYTDANGPDASRAMLDFFLSHSLPGARG
ncbi:PHB depolymerase family esterase [Methylobacterium sp. R2-1]|uniref:extracellular catalytic domain type 1 short-chain-length polyhydroxyalkanoate depolymerase n=1 Tax=Methylobacterium sp. R2-1 TaxID=2587064 RepID=UPI00160E4178|nr:PHB depolymerase family esterase [Methylobacterium sp. R2-1]MBB2960500.1 poly(hydroxyalkanoate) depolymerase family esterase [Methylobacterium sp. R2-1]